MVFRVTRIGTPGCPGQHRHFGELVQGLRSRRKPTSAPVSIYSQDQNFDETRSAMKNLDSSWRSSFRRNFGLVSRWIPVPTLAFVGFLILGRVHRSVDVVPDNPAFQFVSP